MAIYGTENLQPLRPGGGGGYSTGDTYVRPEVAGTDNSLTDLANSLGKLGVDFGNMAQDKQAKDEAQAAKNIDFYKARVRQDIKDGIPSQVQVGNIHPELSPTIHGMILQSIGDDDAKASALSLYEELLQKPELRLDPNAFNSELDARLSAKEKEMLSNGNVPYGAGYLKKFRDEVTRFKGVAQEDRAKWYEEQQANLLVKQNLEAQGKLKSPVSWKTADVSQLPALRTANAKDADHIRGLNNEFATRIDALIAAAPPGIREKLKIASGYRSVARQAQLYAKDPNSGLVAAPGKSNHNFGQAVDWQGFKNFHNTEEGKWVHANAEKFGLYFPLWGKYAQGKKVQESWHMEMLGGRRQNGDGPTKVAQLDDADGEVDDDPIDELVDSFIASESSGNPYAKAGGTSASGLVGYTDAKWKEVVQKHGGVKVAGLGDDAIMGLRMDGSQQGQAFTREMLRKDIEDNANRLRKAGLDVTKGNLYLMHFAGIGDGPKLIAAQDGTPVRLIMDKESLEKNPTIANLTVGQMKQWASEKAGGLTSDARMKANATRAVDQQAGLTLGLSGIRRREILWKDISDRAKATNDAGVLDEMPPELVTPKIAAEMQSIRETVDKAAFTKMQQQWAIDEHNRQETKRATTEDYLRRIANKEQLDLTDPRLHEDKELFSMVQGLIKDEYSVDPAQSKIAANVYGNAIDDAVASHDWREVMNDPSWPIGKQPTMNELVQRIAKMNGMKGSERVALVEGLEKRMNAMAVVASPEANQVFDAYLGQFLKTQQESFQQRFARRTGEATNYNLIARKAFDTSLRLAMGEGVLVGEAKRQAYMTAVEDAMKAVERADKITAGGGANPPAGGPVKPQGTTTAAAAPAAPGGAKAPAPIFEKGVDGVWRPGAVVPSKAASKPAAPGSTNTQATTAAPAPVTTPRVDPLDVEPPAQAPKTMGQAGVIADPPKVEKKAPEAGDAELSGNVQKVLEKAAKDERLAKKGTKEVSSGEDIRSFIDTVAEPFRRFFDPEYGGHAQRRDMVENILKDDPTWLKLRKDHLEGKDGATEKFEAYEKQFVREAIKQLNNSM